MIARRDAVLGAFVLGAFLALTGLVRFAGPALANWKANRPLGSGYANHMIAGKQVNYLVHIAGGEEGLRDATSLAAALDAFIAEAAAPGNELGLKPPDGDVRILVFKDRADFVAWGEGVLRSKLEYNGGFFKPSERLIGFIRSETDVVVEDDVRHEAAHMLMDAASRDAGLPPWLGEG